MMRSVAHGWRVATALGVAVTAGSILACGASTGSELGSGAGGTSGRDSGSHTTSGTREDAGAEESFPLGLYDGCSLEEEPNTLGFFSGTVTLSLTRGVLAATFGGADGSVTSGLSGSLDFTETTGTSASLAPAGQPLPGPWAECGGGGTPGGGIADPVPCGGTLDVASGMLTYDANTLFLTMVGNVELPDGGDHFAGPLTATVTCTRR